MRPVSPVCICHGNLVSVHQYAVVRELWHRVTYETVSPWCAGNISLELRNSLDSGARTNALELTKTHKYEGVIILKVAKSYSI